MTAAPAALDAAAVDLAVQDAEPKGDAADRRVFRVRLDNFEGPFDLLLQLIGQHRMDLTEVALHRVTDDFMAHLRALGPAWDLDQVTEFLVVAATLLDLKTSRLLPDLQADEPLDEDLFGARDLLFARLLAYRAYQQVAVLLAELEATTLRRYPRAVTLEQRYLGLLPDVRIGVDAVGLASLAATAFAPKVRPTVNLDHLHRSTVSVTEHTEAVRELLRARGFATFAELVAGCGETMEIVARFLGVLNLYREAAVVFEQPVPLGPLTVRWTPPSRDGGAVSDDGRTTDPDEEYA